MGLDEVRRIAKEKGIKGEITKSNRKDKKYAIKTKDKTIHFGAKGMSDFTIHKDEKRRKRFHDRFRNNKGYDDKTSGLYYSRKLLW
jgi:hypothetical protein